MAPDHSLDHESSCRPDQMRTSRGVQPKLLATTPMTSTQHLSQGVRRGVLAALHDHKIRQRGAPSSVLYRPNMNATRKRPVSVLMAERLKMHAGSSDAPNRRR